MTILKPDEKDVKRKIKVLLKKYGWYTFMPSANVYGSGGISDHLAVKYGRFLAVEAKYGSGAKGGTVDHPRGTPLQEEFQKAVRAHGGFALVINERNLDQLELLLKRIDDKYGDQHLTLD